MPITVFVADDHPVMHEGLTHLLHAHEDIRVVGVASNGRDAVRQVSQLHPNVLIADIAMPEINGIEATRQIRERWPETRVVILSMHSTPDYIFGALEAGARGYLLKENAASEIVNAVRAVHAGERYLCKKIADVLAEQVARRRGVPRAGPRSAGTGGRRGSLSTQATSSERRREGGANETRRNSTR